MIPLRLAASGVLLIGTPTAFATEAEDRMRDACFFVTLYGRTGPEPTSKMSRFDDERRLTAVYIEPESGETMTTQCIFVDPKAEKPMLEAFVIEPPNGSEDRNLAGVMNGWLEAHYAELAKEPPPVVLVLPDPVQPPQQAEQPAPVPDAGATTAENTAAAQDISASPGTGDTGEVSQEASRFFWCAEAYHQLASLAPGAGSGDWKAEAGKDDDALRSYAELQGRTQLETEGVEPQDIDGFLAEYAESVPLQISGKQPAEFSRAECDKIVSLLNN